MRWLRADCSVRCCESLNQVGNFGVVGVKAWHMRDWKGETRQFLQGVLKDRNVMETVGRESEATIRFLFFLNGRNNSICIQLVIR